MARTICHFILVAVNLKGSYMHVYEALVSVCACVSGSRIDIWICLYDMYWNLTKSRNSFYPRKGQTCILSNDTHVNSLV